MENVRYTLIGGCDTADGMVIIPSADRIEIFGVYTHVWPIISGSKEECEAELKRIKNNTSYFGS